MGNCEDGDLAQERANFIREKEKSQDEQNMVQPSWDYMLNALLNSGKNYGCHI